jgi:hypothetical protein
MGVNKNFVVKNGIEVNTNLVFADADNNLVGIATTTPTSTLNVVGGIGATHLSVTGVGTFDQDLKVGSSATTFSALGSSGLVGVGTASPAYLLDVRSEVSTGSTALFVQGDAHITGDLNIDDIVLDQATINQLDVTGIATISKLGVTGLTTTTDLLVSGMTTTGRLVVSAGATIGAALTVATNVSVGSGLTVSGDANVGAALTVGGNLDVNGTTATIGTGITANATGINVTGVVTATSFEGTFVGSSQIGVGSETSFIGAGITQINFATTTGTNVAVSVPPDTATGIATVTFTPGVSLGLAIALGG